MLGSFAFAPPSRGIPAIALSSLISLARSGHLAAIELLSLSPTDGHFQSLGKTSYPRFADGLSMLESGH